MNLDASSYVIVKQRSPARWSGTAYNFVFAGLGLGRSARVLAGKRHESGVRDGKTNILH